MWGMGKGAVYSVILETMNDNFNLRILVEEQFPPRISFFIC